MKYDWKILYFKVVEISAARFQVHLEHYLTISSKFDVSATVGNLSLASWWRNKNRVNRVAGNMAAWYWAEKVVKMLVQQVTREEKDTPLHCGHFNCDRTCFRLPRIGVKPLELEKVRKIGRKSNRMWTNLYHPCKNIVLFAPRTFSHLTVSGFKSFCFSFWNEYV